MVQIRLFGGVHATSDDGEPIDVGPAKCQAVLASLALTAGSAVPVARLVEMVWGTEPPRTAEKTLQSYVTRLRKGFGADSIVRSGSAYRLEVDAESVDVTRFQRRLDSGDIDSALVEWTGPPLAGLDAIGLTATVDGLVEQWLGAVESDLEHQIEQDAAAAIGPLTELTANHPFREGLWALLMTALYRAGRQADGLAAYRRARQHLVDDLGVEPGPRLRELESSILGQDDRLAVDRSSGGSALGQPTGTVTFGFCDVEDSTRLWSTNSREMAIAIPRHDELVRAAVADHGGYVFATGGDSFGAAFHRAADAAGWAVDVQNVIAQEPWPAGADLRVRIGLHTGETEERGKGYFGPAVIVAARLAAAGHGSQTLVSGVTAALLDGMRLRDLGSFRLDGVVAEQRILQLGGGDSLPLRIDQTRRSNLPRRTGRLIGRDRELAVVDAALASSPMVTLVGPGGIGKTTLALAAARQIEAAGSEAWLIELAGIASSDDVPLAVANVLDVRERPGCTLTEAIRAALDSRSVLLVLDNCEHVVGGAAELAEAIVEGCEDVRVLATSREGLGLVEEQLIVVAPLEAAVAGVELFNERASSVAQAFDQEGSRAEVEEICRRLDGVPLAIELAAARSRTLAPADLLERLDDRLRLLTGGRRTSVERHRTLRATIQWSYDLLPPDEQELFQRLSIFAGPFDLGAAEHVAADPDRSDIDEILGRLVERSMLIVESGSFGRRFRVLETMRQFGSEHLSDHGDPDRVAAQHARWCLDEVDGLAQLLAGPTEIEAVARLAELWPNLRAAVEWACTTGDRGLAHGLVRPVAAEVYMRSRSEIGDWAERILAITPPEDTELVTFGVTWAARRYMRNMDRDGFEHLVGRFGEPDEPMVRYARAFVYSDYRGMAESGPAAAADLRRRGEDYTADLFEVAGLGLMMLLTGQLAEVDAHLSALVERFRVDGPPTCLNWALAMLGTSAAVQGRYRDAWLLYDECAGVAVPERTHTLQNPLEARTAFRAGDQVGAFRLLGSYIDELLAQNNMYVADIAAMQFMTMMAEVDEMAAAARILGYLQTRGLQDVPMFGAMLTTSTARMAAVEANGDGSLSDEQAIGKGLDDRQALRFMRDELARLAAGSSPLGG